MRAQTEREGGRKEPLVGGQTRRARIQADGRNEQKAPGIPEEMKAEQSR